MDIHAHAITSELHRKEIKLILNNCVHDQRIKFLYVSPERLKTDIFIDYFRQMKVNLIAVDEAHCISQWGYDFRPPYLEIAEIRKHHPQVPVLALTATANAGVAKDICTKLHFSEENIIKMSFERKNLGYIVLHSESKLSSIAELLKKIPGSAIIYAGTRRRVKELADALNQSRIAADFYHAGLPAADKKKAENAWKTNKKRVMVATNAFGMGIDKPDVRLVIHADLPSEPEAYFQEAGRAGRDGLPAFAILLWERKDLEELNRKIELKYPSVDYIKSVYTALCQQTQVAYGGGKGSSFPLRLNELCERNEFNTLAAYQAIRLMALGGFLQISEQGRSVSRLRFVCDKNQLYDFRLRHPEADKLIQVLQRSAEGLFQLYVRIDERQLARALAIPEERVIALLNFMAQNRIADYIPATEEQLVTFTENRPHADRILLPPSVYTARKKTDELRSEVMRNYVLIQSCRSIELLAYFGETTTKTCGICDYCRAAKAMQITAEQLEELSQRLDEKLRQGPIDPDLLLKETGIKTREHAVRLVRWKVDSGHWTTDRMGYLRLGEKE